MPQQFNDRDALTSHLYQIEIDGVSLGQFQEVGGLSMERQVIEHVTTTEGGQELIRKLPGPRKYGDVTLKRGMTDDTSLYDWMKEVMEGAIDSARRNGSVVLYDTELNEVARWNFVNGWPSKWEGPSPKANANEIAIESLTLAVEQIEMG